MKLTCIKEELMEETRRGEKVFVIIIVEMPLLGEFYSLLYFFQTLPL